MAQSAIEALSLAAGDRARKQCLHKQVSITIQDPSETDFFLLNDVQSRVRRVLMVNS